MCGEKKTWLMTCCFLTDSVEGNGASLLFYKVMFKTAAVERSYETSYTPKCSCVDLHMVARGSPVPLSWNTCWCISVPQRILLKSIISASFKAWLKHSPLEAAAASKHTYILQVDRKRPLSGTQVMLTVGVTSFMTENMQLVWSICLWLHFNKKKTHVQPAGRTDEYSQLRDCWACPKQPESETIHMLHFYWSS